MAVKRSPLRQKVRLAHLNLLAAMNSSSTLSAAALESQIAQPAASRLLRDLSEDIGIQLFERFGRTIRPTPAGKVLLQGASTLLTTLDRIEDELSALGRGLSGTASLAASVARSYVLVPTALDRLARMNPGISIVLHEGAMGEMIRMLRDGRVDVLIGRLNNALDNRGLVAEKLYDPTIAIVCGPKHPLVRKRNVGWEELLQQKWILPIAGTAMRSSLDTIFGTLGAVADCRFESSTIETNICLSDRFSLIWALSSDIASHFVSHGQLKMLRAPNMPGPGPIMMLRMKGREQSQAALKLAECVRTCASELASKA